MGSISNKSFASNLAKTKEFKIILEATPEYSPPDKTVSAEELHKNIVKAGKIMERIATLEVVVSDTLGERRQLYSKAEDSLIKRLSPIINFVEAVKGKDNSYSKSIKKLIRQIRGVNTKKKNEDPNKDTKTRSNIERTFGSRWTDLGKIIANLSSMGKEYNPPNEIITLASLKILHQRMEDTNTKAAEKKAMLKNEREKRKEIFKQLTAQKNRIKMFVISQFGVDSKTYKKFIVSL